jgi:hypothetical protein
MSASFAGGKPPSPLPAEAKPLQEWGASLVCASAGIVREKSKRGRVGSPAHPGTRTEGFRRNMPQRQAPVGSQVRRTGWGEQTPKEDQNVRSRLRAGSKQAREQMMLAGQKGVH